MPQRNVDNVRGWVYGCPAQAPKGGWLNAWVDETLTRRSECTCENCKKWVEEGDGESLIRYRLEFCACGSPEKLDGWFHGYLQTCKINSDLDLLIAYICDREEWTEHGNSVYGVWLTDKGRIVMLNLYKNMGGSSDTAG